MTTQKQKTLDIGFIRGLGYAIAQLVRNSVDLNLAEYLFNESGFSFEDFVEADVDEYDLKEIREMLNEEDELQKVVREKIKRISSKKIKRISSKKIKRISSKKIKTN